MKHYLIGLKLTDLKNGNLHVNTQIVLIMLS